MGQAEAAARVNVLRQEGPTLLEELQGGQRACQGRVVEGEIKQEREVGPRTVWIS